MRGVFFPPSFARLLEWWLAESVMRNPGKMAPSACYQILRQTVILLLLHTSFCVEGCSQGPDTNDRHASQSSDIATVNYNSGCVTISGAGDSGSSRGVDGKHAFHQVWYSLVGKMMWNVHSSILRDRATCNTERASHCWCGASFSTRSAAFSRKYWSLAKWSYSSGRRWRVVRGKCWRCGLFDPGTQ